MSITYVSGLPSIIVDEDTLLAHLGQDPISTALHVDTDPLTGVAMVSVFFDDGHGNGNCIISVPLVELRKIPARLADKELKYPCTLTVYKFDGKKAFAHRVTTFAADTPKDDMLTALIATRAEFPMGHGVSLTDARGRNIRPEG